MFDNVNELIASVDIHPESIICQHGFVTEGYIASHKHKKAQFLYCEGGIVYIKTKEKTYYLPSRHYIWIAPEEEHYILTSTDKVLIRVIYFPVLQETNFTHQTRIYPINEFLLGYMVHISEYSTELFPEQKEEFMIATSFRILLSKFSDFSLSLSLPFTTDEKMMSIITFLNEQLGNKITLATLSQEFSISQRSVTRLFSSELNMTFIEYLTILRILKSLELLLESKKSISEICFAVGYNSVPTFSNVFQKLVGMRPVEYRKAKKQLS